MSSTSVVASAAASLLLANFASGCAAVHLDVKKQASLVGANTDGTRADAAHEPVAPPFSLSDQTGKTVALSDLLGGGSPAVLVFYRGHWCPFCRRQLGEIGLEYEAFRSRGVNLVAISLDSRENSIAFAHDYGLPFRLLEDPEGKVSSVYVGLENDDTALPGIVLVRPDGHIAYRHIGDGAGDRIQAPQLVQIVDTEFGPPKVPPTPLRGGYSPAERVQLRLEGGGELAQRLTGPDVHPPFGGRASLSALVPLGRWGLVGGLVRGETGDPPLADFDAALKVRKPVLGDVAEFYALIPFGVTAASTYGWSVGAHVGVQVGQTPYLAVYTQLGATYYVFEQSPAREQLRYSLDLGVAFMP